MNFRGGNILSPFAFLALFLFPLATQGEEAADSTAGAVAPSAEEARPLRAGDTIPDVVLSGTDGKPFELKKEISKKHAILIFYRGGWCRYCNTQLVNLQEMESSLLDMGYQLIAISPDKPERAKDTVEKKELDYTVLSDSKMEAAKAFGLAFQLPEDLVKKYLEQYKLDLAAYSGETHSQIPVPAAFIVDRKGKIRFRHADPDYSVRIDSATLLAEAKRALQE